MEPHIPYITNLIRGNLGKCTNQYEISITKYKHIIKRHQTPHEVHMKLRDKSQQVCQ